MADINNATTIISTDTGYSPPPASASVITTQPISGATTVSTGLTNNFFVDSFFLPLVIAIVGVWLWKSGMFGITGWVSLVQSKNREDVVKRQLQSQINKIKQREIK